MEEFVPNSHRSKEEAAKREEKKVEKVVTGSVKPKKKSELRKLTDIFIAEDITNVKSYILMDVVVPAIKDAIEDVVHMLLRGEAGGERRKGGSSPASKVSYRSYYERERDRRDGPIRPRSGYDCDEYVLETRAEAEEVLSRMDDLIATYKTVSAADFYDLVGVSCDYTANKYGWTNIRNAQVVRVRDGYVIKLPRAMPLE